MPATPWRSFSAVEPDREYLAMVSRLPLVSHRTIPRFMRLTLVVARQLQHTPGLVGYSLLAQPIAKTFRTLSAWQDQHALATFTRAMPHLPVMKDLRPHMILRALRGLESARVGLAHPPPPRRWDRRGRDDRVATASRRRADGVTADRALRPARATGARPGHGVRPATRRGAGAVAHRRRPHSARHRRQSARAPARRAYTYPTARPQPTTASLTILRRKARPWCF